MLAKSALGFRLDHRTAVGAIALAGGILGTRVPPAAPFAFGAVLAALALNALAFVPRMAVARRPNSQGKEHPT